MESSKAIGIEPTTESERSRDATAEEQRRRPRHVSSEGLTERVADQVRQLRDNDRALRAGVIAATIGFGLAVWFLRRPDQLLHPYVWVEEYQILNRFQMQGFLHAVLAPVEGYFVLPTSLTVGLAAQISFLHVPLLDYWASTAWFVATLCLILIPSSPIRLRWRVGFVVLLVLAPTNPEVFGIAEYAFWWTTLWPLITILWSKDLWWLRIPALILGGMSSLAGAAIVVPYAFLYLVTRQRRYVVGAALLAIAVVVQAVAYLTSARSAKTPLHPVSVSLQELHNFSDYAFEWLKPTDTDFLAFVGACLLVAIVGIVLATALRDRSPTTNILIALLLALLVVGILSSIPAPLLADPVVAGPRYYFLPYIVLGWVLLLIAVTSQFQWARIGAIVLIAMSLLILSQNFARHDDRVSWSYQLSRCQYATKPFTVPVQYDGTRADLWKGLLVITPATCRNLGYPA
jgi:hypothetical protein